MKSPDGAIEVRAIDGSVEISIHSLDGSFHYTQLNDLSAVVHVYEMLHKASVGAFCSSATQVAEAA